MSMMVMTSSLLPTAMACPLGLQQRLMFSPLVCIVCVHFPAGGGGDRGGGRDGEGGGDGEGHTIHGSQQVRHTLVEFLLIISEWPPNVKC